MLKKLLHTAIVVAALFSPVNDAWAKMTDQQVIEYIKRQSAVGKSEQQIGKELLAKGVTPEQIERLRARYESETGQSVNGDSKSAGSQAGIKLTGTRENRLRNKQLPDNQTVEKMTSVFDQMVPDSLAVETDTITRKKIFGHDIFTNKQLSFEPNENMATPADYRLGPGDEVIIDIWGASEDQIRA